MKQAGGSSNDASLAALHCHHWFQRNVQKLPNQKSCHYFLRTIKGGPVDRAPLALTSSAFETWGLSHLLLFDYNKEIVPQTWLANGKAFA